MKKLTLAITIMLSISASAQDSTKTKQPAPTGEKLYYFAFPANYVDALYSTIGVAADNNKSGISITELRQALAYQANNQPKAPVVDTNSKEATKPQLKTKKHVK